MRPHDSANAPSGEIVRVVRVIEIEGPREWVEETVNKSLPPYFSPRPGCVIRTGNLGFPVASSDPAAVFRGEPE